jgi:hypothetical protein
MRLPMRPSMIASNQGFASSAREDSATAEKRLALWQEEIAREAKQGRGIDALKRVLSELKKEFGADEAFLFRAVDELQKCTARHLSELHYPETIHALFEAAFLDRDVDLELDVETGIKRIAAIDADPEHVRRQRRTPQTTIEAIMYTVRARGVAALKEPANIERLSRCDGAAKDEINQRIARLIAAKKVTS